MLMMLLLLLLLSLLSCCCCCCRVVVVDVVVMLLLSVVLLMLLVLLLALLLLLFRGSWWRCLLPLVVLPRAPGAEQHHQKQDAVPPRAVGSTSMGQRMCVHMYASALASGLAVVGQVLVVGEVAQDIGLPPSLVCEPKRLHLCS